MYSPVVKAAVDKKQCIGCGQCVSVCPLGAIDLKEKARIDGDICMPCGNCIRICPQDAISWEPEGLAAHIRLGPERLRSLRFKLRSLDNQLTRVKKRINRLKKG